MRELCDLAMSTSRPDVPHDPTTHTQFRRGHQQQPTYMSPITLLAQSCGYYMSGVHPCSSSRLASSLSFMCGAYVSSCCTASVSPLMALLIIAATAQSKLSQKEQGASDGEGSNRINMRKRVRSNGRVENAAAARAVAARAATRAVTRAAAAAARAAAPRTADRAAADAAPPSPEAQ